MTDDYHPTVRALFADPRHGGDLSRRSGVRVGRVGGRGQGVSLVLWLDVRDGTICDARFQALACPHTIAAAELLCQRLVGRALGEAHVDAQAMAAELHVPVEKLGRLLLLEDALALAKA